MSEKEAIKQILTKIKPTVDFGKAKAIIDDGILDSLEFMHLISELNEQFGFEVDVDDIVAENFNVPDPITGQAIKLLIKPGDTFSGSIPQVQAELSKSMDYYKVPKNIELVTEIRKTANGKPDRKFYQAGK